MKHEIRIEGKRCRLRPVEIADAEFLVDLRSHSPRNQYINYTPPDIEKQARWIAEYEKRPGDYYFIIESSTGVAEGALGIYNVDENEGTAEWGRWVVAQNSTGVFESVLLVYRAAFEVLGLRSLYSRTVVENRAATRIVERFGMTVEKKLPQFLEIHGQRHDAVQHRITRETWQSMRR